MTTFPMYFWYNSCMVALTNISANFPQRPLRVRAHNHRYRFGAESCSKSNCHASLRKATYAECNRLESCSKDPIGYLDGSNIYRSYFAINGTDPSGTLQVQPFYFTAPIECGKPVEWQAFFIITIPIKLTPSSHFQDWGGYLIQKLTACLFEECCDSGCAGKMSPKDCVTYYEVITFPGVAASNPNHTQANSNNDLFRLTPRNCGGFIIHGEARVYSILTTGPLRKTTGTGRLPFPRSCSGQTIQSGNFPGSTIKPWFWDTVRPVEGPVTRTMKADFNCCCGENISIERGFDNSAEYLMPITGTTVAD